MMTMRWSEGADDVLTLVESLDVATFALREESREADGCASLLPPQRGK
jgi:hypothetical protein